MAVLLEIVSNVQTLVFYLSKILPALVLPLGLVMLLLLLVFATRSRWLTLLAILILYLSSLPTVERFMALVVESGQERQLAVRMDSADAIVVLSGGRTLAPGSAQVSEWNDADRFFYFCLNSFKNRVFCKSQVSRFFYFKSYIDFDAK
jgi:uncharacterized SAM-binding protein YcdF (DUF218 family)